MTATVIRADDGSIYEPGLPRDCICFAYPADPGGWRVKVRADCPVHGTDEVGA